MKKGSEEKPGAKNSPGEKNSFPSTFPIVDIGASAGGLEAFKSFLSGLPQRFDFAVVFIQHLLAKKKSLLPEILRYKNPDAEIDEISDGLQIRPGRICVNPPDKEIPIKKSRFQVTARKKAHLCLPIDNFFESLAEEAYEMAIAIVLSGAGTDGARGIRAIKTSPLFNQGGELYGKTVVVVA